MADEQKIKRLQRERESQQRQQLSEAWRKLMRDPDLRIWLWDFFSRAGIMQAAFAVNAIQQTYNVARQDLGKEILADLAAQDPLAFHRLAGEAQEREAEFTRRYEELNNGE